MSHHRISTATIMATLLGLSLSMITLANSCPTELQQDSKGHWYSKNQPGWKSPRPTPLGIKLSADNFGGAVYSPRHARVACFYKASNGKWVALVSNTHQGITIDKQAKNDSGKGLAWQYRKKHKDYACGYPSVINIKRCQFSLMNSAN